jgi:hypothetical protein
MATRVCIAVMNLAYTDFDGINKAAENMLNGLYVENVLYPNPKVAKIDFEAKYQESLTATADAQDGGKKAINTRKVRSSELYDMMMDQNIPYINGLYKGDREKLLKSGAQVSDEPVPHGLMEPLVIKYIMKGPVPNSVKLILEPMAGDKKLKKGKLTFTVYVYPTAESTTPRVGCVATSSRKLIVTGVDLMTPFYYGVTVLNAAGPNELSSKVKFVLTD